MPRQKLTGPAPTAEQPRTVLMLPRALKARLIAHCQQVHLSINAYVTRLLDNALPVSVPPPEPSVQDTSGPSPQMAPSQPDEPPPEARLTYVFAHGHWWVRLPDATLVLAKDDGTPREYRTEMDVLDAFRTFRAQRIEVWVHQPQLGAIRYLALRE